MVAEIEQKQSFRVFESELQIKLNDCLPFSCSSSSVSSAPRPLCADEPNIGTSSVLLVASLLIFSAKFHFSRSSAVRLIIFPPKEVPLIEFLWPAGGAAVMSWNWRFIWISH